MMVVFTIAAMMISNPHRGGSEPYRIVRKRAVDNPPVQTIEYRHKKERMSMSKFRRGSDDGYDAWKDDRDGHISAQEELDRRMELSRKIAEMNEKANAEFRKKYGFADS